MKKILLAMAALLVLAVSCGKEKISTKKEIDRKDPTSISLSEPSITLYEGEQQTLTLSKSPDYSKEPVVTVTDEKKQTPLLVLSDNESVAYARGLTIQALAPGNAKITASLVNDPSVKATCNVTVLEYINAVTISNISLSKSSVQLSDLGSDGKGESVDITVTLTASESGQKPGWEDVVVSCNDQDVKFTKGAMNNGVGTLTVSVESNTTHKTTNVHTANLTVKAKKGSASSRTLGVDVRGHVYGISVPRLESTNDNMVDKGKVLLVKGKTFDLETQIDKTGTLKDGASTGSISYKSGNSSVLSVSSDGVLSVSGTPLGGSSVINVTVSCSTPGVSSITVPVYTYYEPTGYTFKIDGNAVNGSSVLKAGTKNHILSITATPDKALCDIKINTSSYTSNGTPDLENVTVTNTRTSSSKIEFDTSIYGSKSTSDQIQIASWINNKTATWTFQVDAYSSTDIKVGDYVYYVKNDANRVYYYYSDGGLRADGPDYSWVRRDSGSPLSSSELIGIVYQVTSEYNNVNGIKLRGFRYYGTENWAYTDGHLAHAAVISAKDPKAGTYTWEWSSGYFDIEAGANWNSSTYGQPPKESANSSSYLVYEGLRWWNSKVSESNRVKAIYSVDNYNDYDGLTENAGKSGSCPLRKATGSQYGSTGWVMPLKSDMRNLEYVLDIVKTSITRARNVSSSCADVLAGPYWLANYSKDKYTPPSGYSVDWAWAYCFDISAGSDKFPKKLKDITKLGTRPIVFI